MAIQALNSNDVNNSIIPLGVHVSSGTNIIFSIAESSLPSSIDVYLENRVTNAPTLLTSEDYHIIPDTNINDIERFYLHFMDRLLSHPELE